MRTPSGLNTKAVDVVFTPARRKPLVALAFLLVLATAAVVGIVSAWSTSRAAGEGFTVNLRSGQVDESVVSMQPWNLTYVQAKVAFDGYDAAEAPDNEVTLVFSKQTGAKLLGLPAIDGEDGTATVFYDDANFDITVIFNTTYLDQDVQVLFSARWPNATEFEPEIAVVLRIESVDLQALSDSFSDFPVRFSDAIVGFANVDHTLTEIAAMGTTDFFEDGLDDDDAPLPDNSFHILPGGAALQAVLHDEPAGADPMVEALGLLDAVDTIQIRGTAGKIAGDGDDDPDTKALDLTATITVSTPPSLEETGVTLDQAWQLQIKGEKQGSNLIFFGKLAGKAKMNLDGSDYTFDAALSVNHNKTAGTTTFLFEGSVGDVDNLFGQSWLDLKQFKLSAGVSKDTSKTPPETTVSMGMTAKLTIADVILQAGLTAKINTTTGQKDLALSLTLAVEEEADEVAADSLLSALGAEVDERLQGISLTNFGLHIGIKSVAAPTAGTSLTIVATGGADVLPNSCAGVAYTAGDADLLLRVEIGGTETKVLVGAGVTGLNTKNLSCDIGFEWALPSAMLLVATHDTGPTAWAAVDAPTKAFFQNYFCQPTDTMPCETLQRVICTSGVSVPCDVSRQFLDVKSGGTIHALMTLGEDMEDMLADLGINTSGALRLTGNIPLGGSGFSVSAAFPTITTGQDDIVSGVDLTLSMSIDETGFEAKIAANLGFRVERPNQATCADDEFIEPDGQFSSGKCYDTVDLVGSIEITAGTGGLGLTLDVGIFAWDNAFGEPNITINQFSLHLKVGTGVTSAAGIELGMAGSIKIGETDLLLSFLASAQLGPPPRITIDGFTFGSNSGISLRDIVALFAPDLDEAALPPDLSLKRIWFAYGSKSDNTLCIRQGLYIRAELHLNDTSAPTTGNPACGSQGLPALTCDESSCLAGIEVDIGPKKFFLHGIINEFNLGPLAFQQTEVLIDLSLIKQEISFTGGATLYDPVLWYLATPDGSGEIPVWASAFVSLEVKHNLGVFTLSFEGCALLGGTAEAGPDCPTSSTTVLQVHLDASLTVDFKKVGLAFFEDAEGEVTASVSAPALGQLLQDIEEGLEPAATFFDDAGTAIEGTTTQVVSAVETHFCLAFNLDCPALDVTADAYTNAPAYIDARINATDVAIDNSTAVDFYCFFQVGIPTTPCVDGFRTQAREANEATIAFYGGRLYIALHGIDATGFGGINDADFPDVVYVDPTTFSWPADGTPALCKAGGALEGFALCSIPKGQPLVLDEVISAALLQALREVDPEVVALFEGTETQPLVAASGAMSLAQTAGVGSGDFLADVKKLGAAFDLNKPLAVCEAKATFKFAPTTGLEGSTDFQTKIDAYGGKAIVSAAPDFTGGDTTLNLTAIKTGVITDVLDSAVTDLECPVATPAGVLSFSMSATSINEGDTLTLTGKATAGATVTIDWGDDSTDSTATADEDGDWTASHKYLDGPKVHGVKATTPNAPDAAAIVSVNNVAPTITSVTPPADGNEGGEATLSGMYTDPGTLDTHKLTVTWGDGTTSTVDLAAGGASFNVKHTYVDDNPTGTTQDTHPIGLTLTDKDKGTDSESTSALVKNVAPSELSLDSASWAGGTANRDAAGNLTVPEGMAVTFSGTFRDAGTADTHLISIYWNGEQVQQEVSVTSDTVDPTLKRFTVARIFADDHPATLTPSDLVQVKLQARDDDTGTIAADLSVRVSNVAPVVSVAPATQDVQYSDPLAKVVLTATDVRGYVGVDGSLSETLTTSTRWKVDDGDFEDGLFADLSLSADGCEVSGIGAAAIQSCEWSIEGLADVAPGTYVIEFTVVDDDTGKTVKTAEVVVLPEDARATYTGPTIISAPSLSSGYVDIMLRATVRDSSVVAELNPPDEWPGDITNATVTFVDRATGETLCEADVAPIFSGNTTTGGAACVARLELPAGKSEHTIDVGVVVGGWYLRDDESEDAAVTIEEPTGDWVTGGDAITGLGGFGTHAPNGTAQINLSTGWNMPRLDALTGMLRIRFAAGGRQYELAVTSFDSVGTSQGASKKTGTAQVEARATLFDITASTENPVTVAAGLRLQFQVTDEGKSDMASFAAWADDGLLVASSGWDGVSVPASLLPSGKLQVHFD